MWHHLAIEPLKKYFAESLGSPDLFIATSPGGTEVSLQCSARELIAITMPMTYCLQIEVAACRSADILMWLLYSVTLYRYTLT